MSRLKNNRPSSFPIPALLSGLIVAQTIGSLQVLHSNQKLHVKMQAVINAGFLPVPNINVLPSLESILVAHGGGLFFTLSLGAGLTLATMALAWLLGDAGRIGRLQALILVMMWALAIFWVNADGIDVFVSLYFILIPPLVFSASLGRSRSKRGKMIGAFHLLPVIILALLWFTQFDDKLFIDIRDRLLLSNPIGESINAFYYRYTLYPAEVFKALSEKTIRTTSLEPIKDPSKRRALSKTLTQMDWLPISGQKPTELVIEENDTQLSLIDNDRMLVSTTFDKFFSQPKEVLEDFSARADKHALFRALCFYGLLLGFPILLYVVFHSVFRLLFGLIISQRSSAVAASVICLFLGVVIWLFFQQGRTNDYPPAELADALLSERWQTRVAALRNCRQKSIDVRSFPSFGALKNDPHTAVRYWLVEALAVSERKGTPRELIDFLDDTSINVRTRACDILAERGAPVATAPLLKRLKESDRWYFQMYAYNALRALGWHQKRSD